MHVGRDTGDTQMDHLVHFVKSAHTVVVYMSEGYFQSQFCLLELALAVTTGTLCFWDNPNQP